MKLNDRPSQRNTARNKKHADLAIAIPAALTLATFAPCSWSQEVPGDTSSPVEAQAAANSVSTIPVESRSDQSSAATAPHNKSPSRVIEEIVVTAQKREENLKDVPLSVAAYSGDKLEALGVTDPSQLQQITPGLTYSSQIGYAIIFIRGLGSDAYLPSADTSVATYIDGVYFPFAQNLASQFTKLERVEVLKGPQGTLFGRNSTAGAINIISKEPSETFSGSVDGTLGNFGKKTSKLFVTGPLLDDVSASGSLLYDYMDSFHKFADFSPQQSAKPDRTLGVNLRLKWNISDNVSALLSGYHLHFNGAGSDVNRLEQVKPLGYAAQGGAPINIQEPYVISSNVDATLDNMNDVVYGTIKWEPEPFDVKLSGSYQAVHTETTYDFDGGSANTAELNAKGQFSRTTTSELQLTSKPGGLLADWLKWTGGYYFYRNEGGFSELDFNILATDPTQAGSFPLSLITTGLGPVINAAANAGLPVIPDGVVSLVLRGIVHTQAHAVYAQGTWDATDWFGLTLGARYQYEDRGTVVDSTGVRRANAAPLTVFNFPTQHRVNQALSPKVTLDFHPFSDDTLVYLSFQTANKSGTYNVVTLQTPPSYIKPEKETAFEAGIKSTFFDRTLSYNAAAFHYSIKDLQTIVVSATSGGIAQLLNVPKAEFYGIDGDLTWQVLPEWAPGLVATASGALLHHVFTDFPDGAGFDPTTGIYFGPGELVPSAPHSFTGNKTVRTPDVSAVLGLSYTMAVYRGSLELGADANYSSSYFYDAQNTTKQNPYTLINARASYLYDPWNVRVTVFGKNLTNKVYYANRLADDFGVAATFAAPRTYGMTLGCDF